MWREGRPVCSRSPAPASKRNRQISRPWSAGSRRSCSESRRSACTESPRARHSSWKCWFGFSARWEQKSSSVGGSVLTRRNTSRRWAICSAVPGGQLAGSSSLKVTVSRTHVAAMSRACVCDYTSDIAHVWTRRHLGSLGHVLVRGPCQSHPPSTLVLDKSGQSCLHLVPGEPAARMRADALKPRMQVFSGDGVHVHLVE